MKFNACRTKRTFMKMQNEVNNECWTTFTNMKMQNGCNPSPLGRRPLRRRRQRAFIEARPFILYVLVVHTSASNIFVLNIWVPAQAPPLELNFEHFIEKSPAEIAQISTGQKHFNGKWWDIELEERTWRELQRLQEDLLQEEGFISSCFFKRWCRRIRRSSNDCRLPSPREHGAHSYPFLGKKIYNLKSWKKVGGTF